MTLTRKDRLVGIVVSLPTFTDADHMVLLEPLRKHVRWLVSKGLVTGSAVLRAYPNNPAARKAIRAQAKCRNAM